METPEEFLADFDANLDNQVAEETANYFDNVKSFQAALKSGVIDKSSSVSGRFCVLKAAKTTNGKGTQAYCVNSNLASHVKAVEVRMDQADPALVKQRVVRITLWDPKPKPPGPILRVRRGCIYHFRKIHSVEDYYGWTQGSLQLTCHGDDSLVKQVTDFTPSKRAENAAGNEDEEKSSEDLDM
ncbi:hypothetical protein PHYSODRAFT_515710 [Phytophthora sojae]|uniref:Uncharacterized protein n=1 Tax=Phytophthora sojae (strain P6497) TaxID=1094619 RepID=G4ZVM3_PHYSP|nr:hypothetical protein PHYSODRAFT_515710 [Phytophthora sojae]EGZ12262.1 hypothetical protein PHYSODRAFT_515710 [Phytophthora sojae]|eukprot:XP_009532595.1 hypothetical protein PHYSODRAFT_515710 [Phytophthora sojae]